MNNSKILWGGILIAIVIAIGGYFHPQIESIVGAAGTRFPHGITIGLPTSSPSNISKIITSTCTAATTQLPLEASSTDDFTCTATGTVAGDNVSISLPANGDSTYGGFVVGYAVASTDTVTFGITNLTGAATSSFPLATTSVRVRVFSTQ